MFEHSQVFAKAFRNVFTPYLPVHHLILNLTLKTNPADSHQNAALDQNLHMTGTEVCCCAAFIISASNNTLRAAAQ